MNHIYITYKIPDRAQELLEDAGFRVSINTTGKSLTQAELIERLQDKNGAITMLNDRIDATVLKACPSLRIVANYAVGYNNLDLAAADQNQVMLTNTPDVLTAATADIAWALIFSIARRVVEGHDLVRGGHFTGWKPDVLLGGDITGRTLGIIGAGRIGAATALRSAGFGMKVLYTANSPKPALETKVQAQRTDLQTLLKESDFISIHTPLTDATRHLIGSEELALMKPTAYLINTARGPVVDEAALVTALKQKKIAGAGLDVYEKEPELYPGLANLSNVVLLPHLGSSTISTRNKMAEVAVSNIMAGLAGKRPPNLLNTMPEPMPIRVD